MHAKASAEPADVVWCYYCQVKQYKIEREVKQLKRLLYQAGEFEDESYAY
jgi:hypothetical protein